MSSISFVKRLLVTLPIACAVALPLAATAHADDSKDCAPGSWFCGETAPPPAGAHKDLQPLPADGAGGKAATPPPPVVVYQPPPTTVVVQGRDAPPAY